MTDLRWPLAVGLALWASVAGQGWAADDVARGECARASANIVCPPLDGDPVERSRALAELDAAGRDAAAHGELDAATVAFGCLLAVDPRPETAGNLAVVLRERGLLVEALTAARCAEQLAPPGPTHDRAQARLADIARRLTG